MEATTLATSPLLPEAELARVARILARHLAARQPTATGARTAHRVTGQGMDFLDFREYQPGDDARIIDWRASARSQGVQVRRHCGDVASDWYLCVDSSASMGIQDGAVWLLARKLAAALSYLLLHLGHRVGLLLFSSQIDAACALGRGHPQYARIHKTLYAHKRRPAGGSSDLSACAAVVGQQRPLIVISDFLARDAMLSTLSKLQGSQRKLHIFQLNAPPDPSLPVGDSLLLEDVETAEIALCANPAAAQADAARHLAQLQWDLSAWARRFDVPYTLGNDAANWRELLLRHFIAG